LGLKNAHLSKPLSLNSKGSTYQPFISYWGGPSLRPCGTISSRESVSPTVTFKASHKRYFVEDRVTKLLPTSLSLNLKGSTYHPVIPPRGDPSLLPCGPVTSRETVAHASSPKAPHKRVFEEDRFTPQVNIGKTTAGRHHITQNVPYQTGFQ
jgi:hypothetical protein